MMLEAEPKLGAKQTAGRRPTKLVHAASRVLTLARSVAADNDEEDGWRLDTGEAHSPRTQAEVAATLEEAAQRAEKQAHATAVAREAATPPAGGAARRGGDGGRNSGTSRSRP